MTQGPTPVKTATASKPSDDPDSGMATPVESARRLMYREKMHLSDIARKGP
jgi:hypothetical protein